MSQTASLPTTEDTFTGKDGLAIFYRSWPAPGSPKAVVVICHGFNAHGGQYAWAAAQLNAAGFAVYAADLRGRGQSEGERFYVEDIGDYVADLAGMIAIARERHPGLPVFVLGHSAGGVTGAVYALDHQSEIAGFICESFAFQVPAPGFVIAAIRGVSHVAPHLPILKLANKDFSRDPDVVAALDGDPLITNETQPAMTVAALSRADLRLNDSFGQITVPLLILHGTADHATVCKGSEYFLEHAGSADKTLKLYEGHFHDLLADIGREEVMADIVAWLDARVPA